MYSTVSQTPLLVFSNILIITCLFILLRPALKSPNENTTITNRRFTFCIILNFLFCLFSFWGLDWFGYLQTYDNAKNGYNTNLEIFYLYVIDNLCNSYITFRIIVWGGGLVLLYDSARRLSIPKHIFLFVFSVYYLIFFSYARASLAMAVMFYGLSLLYKPYKFIPILSYILAILAIYASYFLHKSALWGIIIILVSLTSMMFHRKLIIFLIALLFPALIVLAREYLSIMMIQSVNDEYGLNEMLDASQSYLLHEIDMRGLGGKIATLLESIPYYLIAYLCIRILLSELYTKLPKDMQIFTRVLLFLVIGSSIFLFDLNYNTEIIYIRFLRFCMIPASIVLSFFYSNQIMPKLTKLTMILLGVNVVYALLYTFYNVYLLSNHI